MSKSLKSTLRRIYNLPEDGDVYLHFLMPLKKERTFGRPNSAPSKLFITVTCKIFFVQNSTRHFANTGYVGKILLSLPFFVLYSLPAPGYVFLKWILDKATMRGSRISLTDEQKECLKKLCQYNVFEYIGRGCDLTNHQHVLVSRFLARTTDDVTFFKHIGEWRFMVDSLLMVTSFEDFIIQEQLNVSQTISVDVLDSCLQSIVDKTRQPVFVLSVQNQHIPSLYIQPAHGRKKNISVLSNDEDYFMTEADILSVSVGFSKNFGDAVFVQSIRKLWHTLFDPQAAVNFPELDKFLFVACTFDIEVGCIPQSQLKKKRKEVAEEEDEKQLDSEKIVDKFPTFVTGFVQCICFRKILYRKGFEDFRDVIFVHVPDYYKFDVVKLDQMWRANFVEKKQYWLAQSQLVFFASEFDLISEFLFYIFSHVDIFMGFNSMGFDLPFLITRCNFLRNNSNLFYVSPYSKGGPDVCKWKFTGIETHRFTIPSNPTESLVLMNRSNCIKSTFYVVCKRCKAKKIDSRLELSTANDRGMAPCPHCWTSQFIDESELIAERATKNVPDTLALSIHFDLIKSQFVQTTCSRRNLETVVNTSLQETVCRVEFDESTSRLVCTLKTEFDGGKQLEQFIQTYVNEICVALFFIRPTSSELVRLTRDDNRLVDMWLHSEMSNTRLAFDYNDSTIGDKLKVFEDKKVKVSLAISNIDRAQFEQIKAVGGNLKISPGKTSGIDPYTQRNWTEDTHVVETAFYCFIDTMLTTMLENNIKMYMNMYKANYLEQFPGELVYLASGKQVLPKTLKSLIEESMVFNMKTPLQCMILFNTALSVEGVPRNRLGDEKRILWNMQKENEKLDNHPLCVGPKIVASSFVDETENIVKMQAHTTAQDIMKWANDTWNVDEWQLGLMGENGQTLEAAARAVSMVDSSAPSPTKRKVVDKRHVRVSKLNFDK